MADQFFEALFQWTVMKAGDRFGRGGIAAVLLIFIAALGILFWWLFA